jgi:hypothetical protein
MVDYKEITFENDDILRRKVYGTNIGKIQKISRFYGKLMVYLLLG